MKILNGTTISGSLILSPSNTSGTQDGIILTDLGSGSSEGLYLSWRTGDSGSQDLARINLRSNTTGSGGNLIFSTNSTTTGSTTLAERMRISSTGNVGINNASPNTALDVVGTITGTTLSATSATISSTITAATFSGTFSGRVISTTGTSVAPAILSSGDADTGIYFPSAGRMSLVSNGLDSVYLHSNTNVGIGHNAPTSKLDVAGTLSARGAGSAGAILTITPDPTSGTFGTQIENSFVTGGYGPLYILNGGATRLTLATNGNLGIGATSPGDRLHVEGNLYLGTGNRTIYTGGTGSLVLQTNNASINLAVNAGTNVLTGLTNGNIGLGISNPAYPLHVYSAAGDANIAAETNATGGSARIQLKSNGTGGGNYYWQTGDNTSTLNGRLRLWDSSAGAERITILATSGNVGIGVTNPTSKLQISGSMKATSITSDTSAIVGTTLTVGNATIFLNTNLALSILPLLSITTGINNVAIGASVLRFMTTGSRNIGVGFNTLVYNVDGDDNTVVGSNSMTGGTTGSSNSAFGASVLSVNLGSENSAFGVFALLNNTNGSGNAAFGFNSLSSNIDGASNSAFGPGALSSNINGSVNIGIGLNALAGNTSGSSNIAIGEAAGGNVTDGSNNIFIGSLAGQNLTGTDSQNTIIGSSGTAGLNNTVLIGDGLYDRLKIDSSGGYINGSTYSIISTNGGTFLNTIAGVTPTSASHLATKAYVDANAGGGGGATTANDALAIAWLGL